MAQRRKFSAEYKREVVGVLDAPDVSVTQISTELGIGAVMLGRWRREIRHEAEQAFPGNGKSRDEEGYYGWARRPPGARAQDNARLLGRIQQVHGDHDGRSGAHASGKTCGMPASSVAAMAWLT